MNKELINKIASIVNECENNGMYKQADKLNLFMTRIAQQGAFYDPNGKFYQAGQTLNTQGVRPGDVIYNALTGNLNNIYKTNQGNQQQGQKRTLMPNGRFVPGTTNTPQSPQIDQTGQYLQQQGNVLQQPQNQPQTAKGQDLSGYGPRRQQPDFYKNIANQQYSTYLSSGYSEPQAQMIALQVAGAAMQKNMEIPYYHNMVLNEIKNSMSTGQQSMQPTVVDQSKLPQISRTRSFRDQLSRY